MNHATTTTVRLVGLTGHLEPVQAERADGRHPGIVVLGPDGHSMEETRDRAYAAIVNSHWDLPDGRVTVSLPPSHQPPPGSSADLAIAATILSIRSLFAPTALDSIILVGELGLDGSVRPVRGVLPMVAAAAQAGLTTVVVPAANAHEAQLVSGVQVVAVDSLRQFVRWASFGIRPDTPEPAAGPPTGAGGVLVADMADLPAAMTQARWALEVAAAGGHHLGMVGPLGSGKTMLAERLPSILPDLDDADALEVTALRSAAGLLPPGAGLVRRPPLQAPHHTASLAALLGGGPRASRPGSISLAHRGVFYMDDAAEFGHRSLSALRQPMDDGRIVLAGGGATVTYPARIQVVLGAQPCPCASPADGDSCGVCSPQDRARYLARMSELWRRTDIGLRLSRPDSPAGEAGESSAVVAQRVAGARQVAADRWAALGYRVNGQVPGEVLRNGVCRLPTRDIAALLRLIQLGTVSEDGYERILRVAWTISDLRGADRPDRDDITTATDLHLDRRP